MELSDSHIERAVAIARAFANRRGLEWLLDDLESVARSAAWEAVRGYDPAKGGFSSRLVSTVTNRCTDLCRAEARSGFKGVRGAKLSHVATPKGEEIALDGETPDDLVIAIESARGEASAPGAKRLDARTLRGLGLKRCTACGVVSDRGDFYGVNRRGSRRKSPEISPRCKACDLERLSRPERLASKAEGMRRLRGRPGYRRTVTPGMVACQARWRASPMGRLRHQLHCARSARKTGRRTGPQIDARIAALEAEIERMSRQRATKEAS